VVIGPTENRVNFSKIDTGGHGAKRLIFHILIVRISDDVQEYRIITFEAILVF
jgi:hypothetical protein